MKRCCYELEFLNVDKKWLDDTKTTIQLVYYDEFGYKSVLAYVHDDSEVEVAKKTPGYYLDLMFDSIRENVFK